MTAEAEDLLARQWLERQVGGRRRKRAIAAASVRDRAAEVPCRSARRVDAGVVSIYSVAIYRVHLEKNPLCLCDVCVKVRARVSR